MIAVFAGGVANLMPILPTSLYVLSVIKVVTVAGTPLTVTNAE